MAHCGILLPTSCPPTYRLSVNCGPRRPRSRHHYASVLPSHGESVIVVAERVGHENASLVLSTYGHLMPDSEDRTRRAINDELSAPDVPSGE